MKKRKSLLTEDMTTCYLTGRTDNIHIHEVFFGPFRKKSIEYDCCVPLTQEMHNGSNKAVHFNIDADLQLKREMQKAFEDKHSHEKFMEIFKKNYL